MWPWLWLTIVILAAAPWALWLGGRRDDGGSTALVSCLCLSIGLGSLTIWMLVLAVTGLSLNFWVITLPYFAFMAVGGRLAWLARSQLVQLKIWPAGWVQRSIWLICATITVSQLINASYWPFFRDDTLGIYAPYAAEIYESGALVSLKGKPDIAYRYDSYPMMMPLTFAYVYQSAGGVQEYLAKALSALLALATMPAAYLLGKTAHSERAGWVSALLLSLTPAFWRWASAAYVDLPMAFFATLAAYFALNLWRNGHDRNAFLTGFHLGLACWMKNAGLVLLPLLVIFIGLGIYRARIRWQQLFIATSSAFFGGLVWFIWTYSQAGVVIPQTAWTDEAQHTIETLFVFLQWENYAFVGWLILLGFAYCLWQFRNNGLSDAGNSLLLLWFVPFWLIWWWFVSYDPRFVLLFLPTGCVIGGIFVSDRWAKMKPLRKEIFTAALLLCAAIWALYGVLIGIQFKEELLKEPFLSHEEKIAIVRPQERES